MLTSNSISSDQNGITGGVYYLSKTNLTIDGTSYGVKGILYVDKTDTSKRVFFPAAGFCSSTDLKTGGSNGYYRASSLDTSSPQNAYGMYFLSSLVNPSYRGNRCNGFSVRPVLK